MKMGVVANDGDGWLWREMGGLVGRRVAMEGDGWLRREMGA